MPERRDRDHDIQALFESGLNGVATVAPDGTIGLTNNQLATMFGYAAADLTGRPAALLISEKERPELHGLRQEVASGANPSPPARPHRHPPGGQHVCNRDCAHAVQEGAAPAPY